MSKARWSLLAGILLLLSVSGCVSTEPIGFTHETTDLEPDPKAVYGSLKNGMRYVFYPNREPKDRIFAYLRVAAGSSYEKDAHRGIAHYLEHMAFNGSEHFEPGELVKYFQSIGMSFGGDVNAFTSFDQTAYSLDLPNTRPETIDRAFLLLADYARRLSLLQSEIDRERGIILAEMGDRDSVDWRTRKALFRFMYQDALLSQRMPIGLKETVSTIQKDDFDFFYNTWYRPELMTLIVVGDTEFSHIEPRIKKAFGGLRAGAPAVERQSPGAFDHQGIQAFTYYDEEAKATSVSLGQATRSDRPVDSTTRRRYLVTRNMAEHILNRRLQKLAKKEDAVFTSASAYSYDAFGWSRHAGIGIRGEPENWEKMLALVEQELRKALAFGFTDAEVKEEKARVRQDLDVAVLKADTRNSRGMAGQILRSVADEKVFMSPSGRREVLQDHVEGLDSQTLLAAFRKTWTADHTLITVTGNAKVEREAVLAAHKASSLVTVQPPEEKELGEFAYAEVGDPAGIVMARDDIDDLEIVQVTYANGLRLNLRKTDFKQNEIGLTLRFGGGSRVLPQAKEGLGQLAGMIMIEGGLGKHSREDLKSLLAGRSAAVNFSVAEDHLAFSGGTIPEDLELTLQLMRAYFTDPGYREEAVRLARKRFAESYRGMQRTAGGVWNLEVPRLLAGGDIRFGSPALESFNQRTADEVREWIDSQRNMAPLELSIVGDIDLDTCVALAGRYFGSLPAFTPAPPRVKPVSFPGPGEHRFSVPTKIDRGQLSLAWQTTDAFSDIHRTRRVSILSRVIGEYLREEVREEIGGAYSPYARSMMSDGHDDFGYMLAIVKVDPADTARIRDAVLSIATRLHEEGTTEELFLRVLEPTRNAIKKHRRTNDYWMRVISGSLARPAQLNWARSFIEDYDKMTVDEINAYAREYLAPTNAVIAIVEPASTGASGHW